MEAWFPFPDGHQQLEPEPQHEQHQQQYEKERHSMDAPHGPVRGKPLIFAAMTTAADLEQMATLPPRVGHSNSYGYPSPPLEPVVVPAEEHPPAFDTPPTAEKLSAQPEPNPTPHRHSYGAEGDTSSSFLFSPQTSLRKLFKRTSREYEGRTHVGHQRSASDGETHGAGKHRPSKLQKRGTHSSKMSVTSTEMGGVAHIRPDAEMRPRTPTSGPPSPPPKSPSYGIQSAQQAQASVDRSAGVVTDPGPALTAPTDLVSGMNGTYNDPVRPEGEGGLREGGEEEGVAEQEQMPVFTPPRGAKPPTPPISPDEYARSRSRRRGQRLEAITAVVKDIKGKARAVPINPGLPYPLVKHLSNPEILPALLEQLSFWDWCSLSAVSKAIGKMFVKSRDLRECALERYLGSVGYSRWTWDEEEPLVLSIKVWDSPPRHVRINH
ncbi:hypothetical protein NEOLEDRAFT_276959 [Neolentinus lepideus HHB14362 ss-1]|uniref:F-box domain-containing protein n=1 Tax=Neolentinus lepideus HHB14362 ss-1 TaxID=1314782 RepID=A0A165SXP0_9AGAM|nr:hypothetical protein NEOLEDRAFT_276959 [Neolentinus lepideus HHB14362 ss-1]